MATFQEVKAFIDDKIKDNENGEITGSVLNEALTLLLGAIPEGGGSIAVDTQMSDTSENAVQNKVIKKYVDDEVEDAKMYAEEMANDAEAAAKKYTDEKIKNSGGGGTIDESVLDLYTPLVRDFSDDFNNDFTR